MIDSDSIFIMKALDKNPIKIIDFNKIVVIKIDLSSVIVPSLNRIKISDNLRKKCYTDMHNYLFAFMMQGVLSGRRAQWIK